MRRLGNFFFGEDCLLDGVGGELEETVKEVHGEW